MLDIQEEGFVDKSPIPVSIKKTEKILNQMKKSVCKIKRKEISDLLFKGKFNSTDLYNQLEVGKTYKVKTTGKRIHFLSMYKNINEILEE